MKPHHLLQSVVVKPASACLTTPSAFRRYLARSNEMKTLQQNIAENQLAESELREFIDHMMKDLKQGESFPHDPSLAALAVALEPFHTPFVDEFFQTLCSLHIAEMGLSIRTAIECQKYRTISSANEEVSQRSSENQSGSSPPGVGARLHVNGPTPLPEEPEHVPPERSSP